MKTDDAAGQHTGKPYPTNHVPQLPPLPTQDGRQAFWMPGWDSYSTWGYDIGPDGQPELFAQLYRNDDDPDDPPTIWITPSQQVVRTVGELAAAIAEAIAPYEPVPPPTAVITMWMTTPPLPPQ